MLKSPPSLLRLHRLMAALTMSQKRAFKRDARYWGEHHQEGDSPSAASRHVALFDMINKYLSTQKGQGERAGEQLIHYLAKNGWLKGTRHENETERNREGYYSRTEISSLAEYLYNRILQTIRFSSDIARGLNHLNALMQDINFLYNKGLFEDCLARIDDALELAIELDRPSYIHEISAQEQKTLSRMKLIGSERLKKATTRLEHSIQQMSLRVEFRKLDDTVRSSLYNPTTKLDSAAKAKIEQFAKEYAHKVPSVWQGMQYNEPEGSIWLSPRTLYQFLNLIAIFHSYQSTMASSSTDRIEHLEHSCAALKQVFDLLKNFRPIKDEEPLSYYNMIDAYLGVCIDLKKFDQIETELRAIEKVEDPELQYRTKAYINLTVLIKTYKFADAAIYIEKKELAKNWILYKDKFWESRLVFSFFYATSIYFMIGQYAEALKWSKLMQSEVSGTTLQPIRVAVQLVGLIAAEQISQTANPRPGLRKLLKQHPDILLLPQIVELIELQMGFEELGHDEQEKKFLTITNAINEDPANAYFTYVVAWLYADFSGASRLECLKKLDF